MTVYQLSESSKWIAALTRGMGEAGQRGLYSAAIRMTGIIQSEIIPGITPSPVARGVFRAAWRPVQTSEGAEVVNSLPYANFIENGVLAGRVKISRKMIQALVDWIHIKGIGGRAVVSKSGRVRIVKATVDEATQIAWAIAKTMEKRGIFAGGKGLGVLKRVLPRAPDIVREEILREIGRRW